MENLESRVDYIGKTGENRQAEKTGEKTGAGKVGRYIRNTVAGIAMFAMASLYGCGGGGSSGGQTAYSTPTPTPTQTATPPNNAPTIQAIIPQQWAVYQKANDLQVIISDADNDPITSRVEGLPEGMTYADASKFIVGTPIKIGAGTASISASDGKSETIRTFPWQVTEPNYTVKINKLSVRDPLLGIMSQGDYEIPVKTWLKLIANVYIPSTGLREVNESEQPGFNTLFYTNYPALTNAEKDQVTMDDTNAFATYANNNQADGEVFRIVFDVNTKTGRTSARPYKVLENLEGEVVKHILVNPAEHQ